MSLFLATTGGSSFFHRECSANARQPIPQHAACITGTPAGKRRLVLGQSCSPYQKP